MGGEDGGLIISCSWWTSWASEGAPQTGQQRPGAKPKKPRSEAQKAAFEKARMALVEKRKAATASKPPPKPRGRPKKVAEEPVEKPQKKEKKVSYVLEESSSSEEESSSSEEEVVYVKRSRGRSRSRATVAAA